MEKISDTITTVFHIAIKNDRPVVCSSGDGATAWSDTFGLGWRFGIAFNPNGWFAKVRLYLDHNQTQTEQDQATVTVFLRDSADKDAKGLKERASTITDFGHGQPFLLGSWSPSDIASHPYVSLTLTTKTRLPQLSANPLPSASLALGRSLESGDFVDTKFYVFSAKGSGTSASKPRVVYANSDSIGLVVPRSTSRAKRENGSVPAFLVNMTTDHHIDGESVLHNYEYEQDSDLDDESEDDSDNTIPQRNPVPGKVQKGSAPEPQTPTGSTRRGTRVKSEEFPAEPPAYSVSTCRMVLVKGVAHRTWLAYIYFRYTGQVSFRPLKSARGASKIPPNGSGAPPSCSPKSMYRLAASLGDERMKELALRAIKEGLSKDNIVEEAFSWFTAQYPIISEYEVERVSEFRKLPEFALALKLQLKAVSLGEKPWADNVLIAIMDKLNQSESSI
ncbi:hypothetical protein HD554DRAFT_2171165 [Boletus coccyginus]|nr:hypothetical protein HD554DRAFT_2171165 [Boletus coccyginus]